MSLPPGCGEESEKKPLDLVKIIPGVTVRTLVLASLLVPPHIRRAGPLESLASASLLLLEAAFVLRILWCQALSMQASSSCAL